MALKKLTLRPGVNKEGTNYANEDGFYNSDKIRFRSGYAEKIGGWQNINFSTSFYGVARSMWAWVSNSLERLLGLGTTQKFYIEYGTQYYDITPIASTTTLGTNPFATTNGALSVTVTQTAHNMTPGTFVTYAKATTTLSAALNSTSTSFNVTSVTGFSTSGTIKIDNELITYTGISTLTLTGCTRGANGTTATSHTSGATVLSRDAITVGGVNLVGEFQVVSVVDANSYTVNASSPATSTATGGTGTIALDQISAGSGSYYSLSGWGAVPWNTGAWGSGVVTTTTTPIRLWSQSNYNENLIFAPRQGAIYWWTKDTNSFPRAITLNAQAGTQVKASTTASWDNGASTITVADATNINTGATVLDGVGIPAGTYVTTGYTFGTTVPLSQATTSVAATTNTTTLVNSATLPQTVTLTSVTNYPTSGVILVGAEQISYSGIVGNVLTITARGYNSTTVALHAIGSAVSFVKTLNVAVTFSYAGYHVPNETLVVTTSNSNAFTIAFGANPYNPYNFSETFDPLLIRWSDQDNPYEWVPETTNQSGEQRLSNGSTIVTALSARQETLVWTDTALYSMQYLGPPYVWGINLLMDNLSIASQNAAISVNNITYWMGVDRFYQYSGRVETLPCTLRSWVFNDINRDQLDQVCCGTNEGFNEVWWFYPSADSLSNNRYVVFNHLDNVWYYGELRRSAWLDTQLENYPLGAYGSDRTTLEEAITDSQTTIHVKDLSTFPSAGTITIGSEQISYTSVDTTSNEFLGCTRGANSTTAASHLVNSWVSSTVTNQIMYHEYEYDDRSMPTTLPIAAYIESSDFDLEDGFNFAYVWRIIPDLTFTGSTATNPQCQLTVKVRQNSGAAYTPHSTDAQTVVRTATYPVEQFTGQVYTRVRGRQMAFRMASVDTGVFWQMGLMRIDVKPDGRR